MIVTPDLAVVVDDTLVGVTTAGVLQELSPRSILLIHGHETAEEWQSRIKTDARIIMLPTARTSEEQERPYASAACVGAAACVTGVISLSKLKDAVRTELRGMTEHVIDENLDQTVSAYEAMGGYEGLLKVQDQTVQTSVPPDWIDLPLDPGDVAAPAIFAGGTSVEVRTGLWRTMRPVLEPENCNKCIWICGSYCPDGVITPDKEGYPQIDFEHCKGCLICVATCPKHAFLPVAEQDAVLNEGGRI